MSTISASTTTTTGFVVTSNTTGTLVFQTGASPTTALTLGSDQSVTFAGASSYSGLATFAKGSSNGITIGDVTTNSNSVLRMQGTSAGKNWQIANNLNVAGIEFTPSTANGGTTYTTPALAIQSTGNVGIGISSSTSYRLYVKDSTAKATTTGYPFILSSSDSSNTMDFIVERWGNSYYKIQVVEQGVAYKDLVLQSDGGAALVGITTVTGSAGKLQSYQSGGDCFECVTADGSSSNDYGIGWSITSNGQRFARIKAAYQSSGGTGAGDLVLQTKGTGTALLDRLTVYSNGTVAFNAYGAGTLSTNSSGVISASDGRYKTKTRGIENALELVAQLAPTYYRWDEETPFYNEGYEELGFIAQEVAAVVPEASPGIDTLDEDKFRNYSDRSVVAILTKAIQELKAELDAAKADIATLKGAA
jgi:hypothetical protein